MNLLEQNTHCFKWTQEPIAVQDLGLDLIYLTPYFYEQGFVRLIEQKTGEVRQHVLGSVPEYVERTSELKESEYSIKIEGIESLTKKIWDNIGAFVASHSADNIPFSAHCFIAKNGSPSFPNHTDNDSVAIYVLEGIKVMYVEGVRYELHPGDVLWIKNGVTHRANNEHDSVMLSIGFERYHMEKLYG